MDTSNLRITDTQDFDLEYEMFLSNVLIYKKMEPMQFPLPDIFQLIRIAMNLEKTDHPIFWNI
ncbi:hypothetical protein BOQ62_10605 [Chryseobacterium sp. CH21]|uniref:hypothetical protein n=1 Tax=Chryseobacterium sp. CH21 TaxID=713556 RepID=UPI00100B934B|nr:hypothetical protein [Chryseobacterium sp. CH21]RXM39614.1 hypothetical protein BOQ62_10605 [Chryseobacterium sp. CH21]